MSNTTTTATTTAPAPITKRQAEARRANGKLSRGPVTAIGKSISSQNAVKHGLFARNPLLDDESEADFAALRQQFADAFRPEGGAEVMLVERLADAAWRLRRVPAVEAAIYTAEVLEEQAEVARRKARALVQNRTRLDLLETSAPAEFQALLDKEAELREQLLSPEYALGRAFRRSARGRAGFIHLSRCEMLLDRCFYRCLRELQSLQEKRKRQNEPTTRASRDIQEA